MLYREARKILDDNCRDITGKPASTGSLQHYPRKYSDSSSLAWWTKAGGARETTGRTKAYLMAYCQIAGSARFPAEGINLDDGYIWIDKGVARFALSKGLMSFDEDTSEFIVNQDILSTVE